MQQTFTVRRKDFVQFGDRLAQVSHISYDAVNEEMSITVRFVNVQDGPSGLVLLASELVTRGAVVVAKR